MIIRVFIIMSFVCFFTAKAVIAGDTKKQITTTATISYMLETFPQAVLSTINSVIAYSSTASLTTTEFDSLARKDNIALQLGMWQTSRVGIGAKYWLSELTALRLNANTSVNLGLSANADLRNSKNTVVVIGDSSIQNRQGNSVGYGYQTDITPSVTLDVSISAMIEKHLFPKKQVSPYIGFGMGVSIYSDNYTIFSNRYISGTDTGGVQRWYYSFGGDYLYVPNNSGQSGGLTSQLPITRNIVNVSGSLVIGVEYFVLPSLSITAEALGNGNIRGVLYFMGNFQQSQTDTQQNGQSGISKFNSTYNLQNPQNSISTGLGFSSSLTLSVYFGRNVLGDILDAFSSGSVFQW